MAVDTTHDMHYRKAATVHRILRFLGLAEGEGEVRPSGATPSPSMISNSQLPRHQMVSPLGAGGVSRKPADGGTLQEEDSAYPDVYGSKHPTMHHAAWSRCVPPFSPPIQHTGMLHVLSPVTRDGM